MLPLCHRDPFFCLVCSCNGVTMCDVKRIADSVALEALLTGLGRGYNNIVYTLPIEYKFLNYNSIHLEMINPFVALQFWCNSFHQQKGLNPL